MVVEIRFRGGHKFKKSDIITLEPEPSNIHDINAIKVIVNTHRKKNYNQSASLNLEYPWM
ncbi:8248_t:CDS:2, partial [Racocetra persica]